MIYPIIFCIIFVLIFVINNSVIHLISMARYLNPTADLTFKRIFAEHPHLLINFLNSVMPFENGRYITDIDYLPTEMVPDNPGKKFSIVDVRCKDNFKRHFIVEMQGSWYEAFMNRIVFNAGKACAAIEKVGRLSFVASCIYTFYSYQKLRPQDRQILSSLSNC
jgi:hypothetical protein